MAMINVHPDIDDPFYRYKMPKLIAKIEGSGNGIKTAVVNMSAIAKALNRSPEYTTKFFGCELGAQVQMYPKDDRWIVNGAHDGPKLQSILSNFVKKFVLCENCENPETNLIVNKNDISQKCLACGHVSKIPMVHRLTSYIANHPPQSSSNGNAADKKGSSKRDKKQKQKRRNADETVATATDSADVQLNEIDELAVTDADSSNRVEDNDTSWSVDVTEEASRRRVEVMTKGLEDLTVSPSLIGSESERADKLYRFILDNLETLTESKTQEAVFEQAKRYGLVDKAPLLLSELLASSNKILSDIKKYQTLLYKFCEANVKAQKYLLGGIEKIVGLVLKDELIDQIPLIFMELYQQDLVDESTFKSWDEKPSRKYIKDKTTLDLIHLKAKPFLKWLDEADVEGDDSTIEEEDQGDTKDVDVIFSFRDEKAVSSQLASSEQQMSVKSSSAKNGKLTTQEDDSIDIDAI